MEAISPLATATSTEVIQSTAEIIPSDTNVVASPEINHLEDAVRNKDAQHVLSLITDSYITDLEPNYKKLGIIAILNEDLATLEVICNSLVLTSRTIRIFNLFVLDASRCKDITLLEYLTTKILIAPGIRQLAMLCATINNNLPAVKLLDTNKKIEHRKLPLEAASRGHIEILEYFLESKIKSVERILCIGVKNEDIETIKLAIKYGAVGLNRTLVIAARNNSLTMCRYIVGLGVKNFAKPLFIAAEKGHIEIVRYFISLGIKNTDKAFAAATDPEIRQLLLTVGDIA